MKLSFFVILIEVYRFPKYIVFVYTLLENLWAVEFINSYNQTPSRVGGQQLSENVIKTFKLSNL